MSKYYRVYADVDLDAIRANCIELMSKTEPSTKALAVVKADGYGHGDVAVSKAVRDLVYGYAVATLDEAVNLRENGINKPILILGYVEPEEYEALVKNEIDATVFDYETAKALNDVALRLGKVAFCHIKVDTGMRRIGLEPDESGVEIVKKIKDEFPDFPVIATGGPNEETIRKTIEAGANAITYTPPANGDTMSNLMDKYRSE